MTQITTNTNECSILEEMRFLVENKIWTIKMAIDAIADRMTTEQRAAFIAETRNDWAISGNWIDEDVHSAIQQEAFLEAICRYADAHHLTNSFVKSIWYDRFHASPALTLVRQSVAHREDFWETERDLVIRFVERDDDKAPIRVLCESLEADGKRCVNSFIPQLLWKWEQYLNCGITLRDHEHYEARMWFTPGEIRWWRNEMDDIYLDWSERYQDDDSADNADPALDRPWLESDLATLPPNEWCETIAVEDLIAPYPDQHELEELEELEEKRMPRSGAPTSLQGLSLFEAACVLQDAEVFSWTAIYGLLAHQLDADYNLRMLDVLCAHIDNEGELSEFAGFIDRALEPKHHFDWRKEGF